LVLRNLIANAAEKIQGAVDINNSAKGFATHFPKARSILFALAKRKITTFRT
jgi:hypothetical protein